MGVMDRFLNAMRLNSDEDDYYDDDDEFYDDEGDDEEDDYEPRRKNRFRSRRDEDDLDVDDEDDDDEEDYAAPIKGTSSSYRSAAQPTSSKVTPMRTVRRSASSARPSSSNMQVCVIKPISVDDAREITDTLVSNHTVILNLEGMDLDVAQRIIDFSSGSCYAIGGNLQKVSNYIFVVTPPNVDISGDIQNIMSTFGETSSLHADF